MSEPRSQTFDGIFGFEGTVGEETLHVAHSTAETLNVLLTQSHAYTVTAALKNKSQESYGLAGAMQAAFGWVQAQTQGFAAVLHDVPCGFERCALV